MKKSVIIGSLVAGAFLLPAIASAGVATGRCDKCHTMHASQNGSTTTPNNQLLVGSGCIGCHAEANNSGTNGKGGTANAPQVIDATGTTTLSGGYFTAGAWDGQHNVTGVSNEDSNFGSASGWLKPGGGTSVGRQMICEDCHASAGHHSTTSAYRLLSYSGTSVLGTGDPNYGYGQTRSLNQYEPVTMNAFCDSCHPDFHGAVGGVELGNYGSWVRHPVGITLTTAQASTSLRPYTTNYSTTANATDFLPLGDVSGTKDTILCITCHVPHGNGNLDMLSFSYNLLIAGNTAEEAGCESCHSYNGTDGY